MTDDTGATPENADVDVDYEDNADYRWTEKAHELLEKHDLDGYFLETDGVRSAHVWGTCPRCGHSLDDRPTLTTVVTTLRAGPGLWDRLAGLLPGHSASPGPDLSVEVDVVCGCGHSHAGAPDKTSGCGVSFRLEVPRRGT